MATIFLLKTQNLTSQDHSINIEAMLAPNRTYLLMNKHKTLSSKFRKEKNRVEKQRDSTIHSYVSEKRMVDRRYQELYIKRVNMFLKKLSPEMKKTILERKAFSVSLNKIQEENSISEVPQKSQAPLAQSKTRERSRSRSDSLISDSSRRKSICDPVAFPSVIPEQMFKDPLNPQPYTERLRNGIRKKSIAVDAGLNLGTSPHLPRVPSASGNRKEHHQAEQSPVSTPNIIITKDRTSDKCNEEVEVFQTIDKKKIVRFDNPKKQQQTQRAPVQAKSAEWQMSKNKERLTTSFLEYKVKKFNNEQREFNKHSFIIHSDTRHHNVSEKTAAPSENKDLVNLFDVFCENGIKFQVQKLVKLATKIKKHEMSFNIPSSVTTISASKSYKRMHTAPGLSLRKPVAMVSQ